MRPIHVAYVGLSPMLVQYRARSFQKGTLTCVVRAEDEFMEKTGLEWLGVNWQREGGHPREVSNVSESN